MFGRRVSTVVGKDARGSVAEEEGRVATEGRVGLTARLGQCCTGRVGCQHATARSAGTFADDRAQIVVIFGYRGGARHQAQQSRRCCG